MREGIQGRPRVAGQRFNGFFSYSAWSWSTVCAALYIVFDTIFSRPLARELRTSWKVVH